MTAETPMIMPSMVSPVRILLRPSALNAMRNVITGDMFVLLPAAASAGAAATTICATTLESALGEALASGLTKWERRRRRTRLGAGRYVRHDVGALLQI